MTIECDTKQTETDFIPIPPDFPVNWEEPGDKYLFWQLDSHFPSPLSPLDFHLIVRMVYGGSDKACRFYGFPITMHSRHINTCLYAAVVYDPEETDAKIRQSVEKLKLAMTKMAELWENEWLPEIRTHLAYWETYDVIGISMQALAEHLDETVRRASRCWEIHFLLYLPMLLAPNLFEEMYNELFSDAGKTDAYELLSGFENANIESSRALWELSRHALASSTVYKVLTDNDAADVIGRLGESAEGQSFLADFDKYLQEYGKRSDKLTLAIPSWIESPSSVIRSLQDYVNQPDRDLTAELKEIKERREQRVVKIREQLRNYPRPVANQFESLLKAAQTAYRLREDHGHWIDFQVTYHLRRVVLEFGRRLAEAGAIDSRDDIFCLTPDELKKVAEMPHETATIRRIVNECRSAEKQFAEHTPPMTLGAMPSGSFPDDPMSMAFFKIEGSELPAPEVSDGFGGHPASPGTVRGTAKVVRFLSEAEKLEPGDIMVAESTGPAWTPVFASIAGLVTDIGGILSHSAIVAREYGIPCVVGTGTATSGITDGQIIEVDGDRGVVRIIDKKG